MKPVEIFGFDPESISRAAWLLRAHGWEIAAVHEIRSYRAEGHVATPNLRALAWHGPVAPSGRAPLRLDEFLRLPKLIGWDIVVGQSGPSSADQDPAIAYAPVVLTIAGSSNGLVTIWSILDESGEIEGISAEQFDVAEFVEAVRS